MTIRITLSPFTDGETESRKGIRLVARGNHCIHSFPNLSRNILELSRLSVPTPRLFMILGKGTPGVGRGSSPITNLTPSAPREFRGFKWPHPCLRPTFCNLRYLEGHKLESGINALYSSPSPTSTPPTRESLFSWRVPMGPAPAAPTPSAHRPALSVRSTGPGGDFRSRAYQ